jgi:flagellar protein FlgJ
MTNPVGAGAAGVTGATRGAGAAASAAATPREQKLRKVTHQLEGVFVQQLFKAMRETVPQDEGVLTGGSGQDMFTGLLDEHLAAETPQQWNSGLGEALFRQLRGALAKSGADATPSSGAQREGSR